MADTVKIPTDMLPPDKQWLGDMDLKMAREQFGWIIDIAYPKILRDNTESGALDLCARITALYRWFGLEMGEEWDTVKTHSTGNNRDWHEKTQGA